MTWRRTRGLAVLGVVVVVGLVVLARAGDGSGQEAAPDPVSTLDPALPARLAHLPGDRPVRVIATLEPGTATEPLRRDIERLGGQLVERFTLIDAVVVVIPAHGVRPLAQLPDVRRVEPADSGEPPPMPR